MSNSFDYLLWRGDLSFSADGFNEVDGVIHYAVDNTPAMYPITVTKVLSEGLTKYLNILMESEYEAYPDNLKKATVIRCGNIEDKRITEFRKAKGVFTTEKDML